VKRLIIVFTAALTVLCGILLIVSGLFLPSSGLPKTRGLGVRISGSAVSVSGKYHLKVHRVEEGGRPSYNIFYIENMGGEVVYVSGLRFSENYIALLRWDSGFDRVWVNSSDVGVKYWVNDDKESDDCRRSSVTAVCDRASEETCVRYGFKCVFGEEPKWYLENSTVADAPREIRTRTWSATAVP
jgi:hypothetical protein